MDFRTEDRKRNRQSITISTLRFENLTTALQYALLYANYISFSEGTMAKFALKGHEQTLFRHFPLVLIYAEATFKKLLNYTNNSAGCHLCTITSISNLLNVLKGEY